MFDQKAAVRETLGIALCALLSMVAFGALIFLLDGDRLPVALAIVIWPNLIALLLLAPIVVAEAKSYFERKPYEAMLAKNQSRKLVD